MVGQTSNALPFKDSHYICAINVGFPCRIAFITIMDYNDFLSLMYTDSAKSLPLDTIPVLNPELFINTLT